MKDRICLPHKQHKHLHDPSLAPQLWRRPRSFGRSLSKKREIFGAICDENKDTISRHSVHVLDLYITKEELFSTPRNQNAHSVRRHESSWLFSILGSNCSQRPRHEEVLDRLRPRDLKTATRGWRFLCKNILVCLIFLFYI